MKNWDLVTFVFFYIIDVYQFPLNNKRDCQDIYLETARILYVIQLSDRVYNVTFPA